MVFATLPQGTARTGCMSVTAQRHARPLRYRVWPGWRCATRRPRYSQIVWYLSGGRLGPNSQGMRIRAHTEPACIPNRRADMR